MSLPVEFWFEFASTYSYLAAHRIQGAARERGVEVVYRPFLLGPIFEGQGWNDSPFNIYPAKGRYMWRDMERLCSGYGLPFRKPTVFPRSGLLAARVAILAAERGFAERFVPEVYTANFARDEDITSRATVGRILNHIGQEAAAIFEEASSEATKGRLREQTERAAALGIFGAPSFVIGQELFWGNDRLEAALEWACDGTAPATPASCGFPNDF